MGTYRRETWMNVLLSRELMASVDEARRNTGESREDYFRRLQGLPPQRGRTGRPPKNPRDPKSAR